MKYKSELKKIDELIEKADKKSKNLIRIMYDDVHPKYILDLLEVVKDEGADWECTLLVDINKKYHEKKIEIDDIRAFDKLNNKYGNFIKYNKGFMDRLSNNFFGGEFHD